MSKREALFPCAECPSLGKVFKLDNTSQESLNVHYRNCHWGIGEFVCGVCGLLLENKTSMIRHIAQSHASDGVDSGGHSMVDVSGESFDVASTSRVDNYGSFGGSVNTEIADVDETSTLEQEMTPDPQQNVDLSEVAGEIVMELRSTARLTNAAMLRFQDGYRKLLDAHTTIFTNKVSSILKSKGVSNDVINAVLEEVRTVEDPFSELNSIEKQLKYYESKYGLVIPKEYFLDSRIDNRLDPKLNEYVPTQVSESFQYVPITGTLKLIMSNKKYREQMFRDMTSKDGVLRSYFDGYDFKNHPFLQKHQNVLLISLFYDELEIASALGSKTIIHKLGVFFFQILNVPAHLMSKLSSIHLLALAYAEDMKKECAFEKVLFHFVQEMKMLGSDEGVTIDLDGDPFTIRAILVEVSADTLAAHDLLGFLPPSARHFCRVCNIRRQDFRQDGNTVAPLRTRADHDQQVLEVKENPRLSTQYGVKRDCCLNQCPGFHCVDSSVFDCFHDLLEGCCPEVLRFVLRNFIFVRELFTVTDFNIKVASFSYGIPDSRNKPTAAFTKEMLTSRKKLKQTGTQMWCLIRAFPFLVPDSVPEGDDHMEIIFTLQDILKIVFSFEVSNQDLAALDNLVCRLIDNFKRLFVDVPDPNEILEDEEASDCDEIEDVDELDEASVDDPTDAGSESLGEPENEPQQRRKKKKPLKVHLFNKLHHLKHYSDQIKRKGPIVKLWCAKFEASLKIFRQYAGICCNFRNPPKTMGQMFQLSHLWSLVTTKEEDSFLEFGSGSEMSFNDVDHPEMLQEAGITKFIVTNKVIVNGEEYRPGLFIAFKECRSTRTPQFSIITDIYVVGGKCAYLVLKPWNVLGLSSKFNAYQVSPNLTSVPCLKNVLLLRNFQPIAPWNSTSGDIYVSPRLQVL